MPSPRMSASAAGESRTPLLDEARRRQANIGVSAAKIAEDAEALGLRDVAAKARQLAGKQVLVRLDRQRDEDEVARLKGHPTRAEKLAQRRFQAEVRRLKEGPGYRERWHERAARHLED